MTLQVVAEQVLFAVGLKLSQRQSEADQHRLWNHLSAHIASVQQSAVAVDLLDSAANQWSHLVGEGRLSGLHATGGLQLYSGRPSRLSDVHTTAHSKAGRLPLTAFCQRSIVSLILVHNFVLTSTKRHKI